MILTSIYGHLDVRLSVDTRLFLTGMNKVKFPEIPEPAYTHSRFLESDGFMHSNGAMLRALLYWIKKVNINKLITYHKSLRNISETLGPFPFTRDQVWVDTYDKPLLALRYITLENYQGFVNLREPDADAILADPRNVEGWMTFADHWMNDIFFSLPRMFNNLPELINIFYDEYDTDRRLRRATPEATQLRDRLDQFLPHQDSMMEGSFLFTYNQNDEGVNIARETLDNVQPSIQRELVMGLIKYFANKGPEQDQWLERGFFSKDVYEDNPDQNRGRGFGQGVRGEKDIEDILAKMAAIHMMYVDEDLGGHTQSDLAASDESKNRPYPFLRILNFAYKNGYDKYLKNYYPIKLRAILDERGPHLSESDQTEQLGHGVVLAKKHLSSKHKKRKTSKGKKRKTSKGKKRKTSKATRKKKKKASKTKKNVGGIIPHFRTLARSHAASVETAEREMIRAFRESQRRERERIERERIERERIERARRQTVPAFTGLNPETSLNIVVDTWRRSLLARDPAKLFMDSLRDRSLAEVREIADKLIFDSDIDNEIKIDIDLYQKVIDTQNKKDYIDFIKTTLWKNRDSLERLGLF